ncbi:hypothetical protein GGR88_002932 [Sphingomonas jejuensis]|uniref:Uncharacterized protein n=1 Tax=Sphingomonas jejuensis TaxID=904715 RepID=A0ABX0XPU0_9SPHN|nr:hypothetical protein [Sphingomonas jejuensis]
MERRQALLRGFAKLGYDVAVIACDNHVDRRLHVLENEDRTGDVESMLGLSETDTEHKRSARGLRPGARPFRGYTIKCRNLFRRKSEGYRRVRHSPPT